MSLIFNIIFYKPLLNSLVWLINILPVHDVGTAVIILTLAVRLILYPLNYRAIITQRKIKEIEPELRGIKEKFKTNSQEQAKRTMELYKKHGISPFSGILTLIIQIPIIIALYQVFLNGLSFEPSHLYPFVKAPLAINTKFLGLIDMTQKSYALAFITGLSQFLYMKISIPAASRLKKNNLSFKEELTRNMSLQFKYIMPVLIFFIASRLSSAIGLYWTTMNIFAIVQEIIVKRNGRTSKNNQRIAGNDT